MRKKKSVSQRVRELIEQGHNNKYIVGKLQCKPQVVYNVRYQINKSKGLGALGTQGTGISAPPVWNPPALQPMPEPFAITMFEPEPKPTLWQRVKGWFRGTNA